MGPRLSCEQSRYTHSTGPGVTRMHEGTKWTQSPPPWVSEGGDSTRKPRLLRPGTELGHRVGAILFLRSTTPSLL